jgi:hypothetical protein
MLPGEAMIQTVQTCVRAPAGMPLDEYLDQFTPLALVWLSGAAVQLSSGVAEAKKAAAARTQAQPGSATTSPPKAS